MHLIKKTIYLHFLHYKSKHSNTRYYSIQKMLSTIILFLKQETWLLWNLSIYSPIIMSRKTTSSSSAFWYAIWRDSGSMSMLRTCLINAKINQNSIRYSTKNIIWLKGEIGNTHKHEFEDATHSASKRAAAMPKVPQPHPKSATTFSVTSSKEFSAWFSWITKETGL